MAMLTVMAADGDGDVALTAIAAHGNGGDDRSVEQQRLAGAGSSGPGRIIEPGTAMLTVMAVHGIVMVTVVTVWAARRGGVQRAGSHNGPETSETCSDGSGWQ